MRKQETFRFSIATLRALSLASNLALHNGIGEWAFVLCFNIVVIAAMYYSGLQVIDGVSDVQTTVTFLLITFDLSMEIERLPEALYSISGSVGGLKGKKETVSLFLSLPLMFNIQRQRG